MEESESELKESLSSSVDGLGSQQKCNEEMNYNPQNTLKDSTEVQSDTTNKDATSAVANSLNYDHTSSVDDSQDAEHQRDTCSQPISPTSIPTIPVKTNNSCNCACHHMHHHHHHHTIFINGQPEITTDSPISSLEEIRQFYRPGVLKTISCPPWADGTCKDGRAIRNYNCNSNRETNPSFAGSDARRVYLPVPTVNNDKQNEMRVQVGLSGVNPTHVSEMLEPPPQYGHHGPPNKTKRRCWNLPRSMKMLIIAMFIIIVSLLCGLVFFLVRGNSSSIDNSRETTAGSSSIPSTTTVINQTSVCGIIPSQYLLINQRFDNPHQVIYNDNPPQNDSRILLSPRIIGGRKANIVQYPWQASLWVDGKGITCGGSVIMRDWILTAAHCTEANKDPNKWTAYMGMSAVSEKEKPPTQSSKILKIIQHENYKDDFTYDYDISLMKLVTPVTFSQTVQPICLPSPTDVFDDGTRSCYISGWGATDNSGEGPPPNVLQHAQVDIFDYATCTREDWLYSLVTKRMMCAGKINGSSDACQGDSGGPLSCYNASLKIWTLAGSVSWGIECGQPRHPGVYTKMPVFVHWIWISIGISDGLILPWSSPPQDNPAVATTSSSGLSE